MFSPLWDTYTRRAREVENKSWILQLLWFWSWHIPKRCWCFVLMFSHFMSNVFINSKHKMYAHKRKTHQKSMYTFWACCAFFSENHIQKIRSPICCYVFIVLETKWSTIATILLKQRLLPPVVEFIIRTVVMSYSQHQGQHFASLKKLKSLFFLTSAFMLFCHNGNRISRADLCSSDFILL